MATVRGSRLKNATRPVLGAPAEPLTGARPAEQLTDRGSPESRRERQRREIFERLVEAARQLMFDRSLDDARVQDITDLADVGKGTFFNFFSAKELVIPEVMRERVRPNRSMVEQVKAGQVSSREALNYFINRVNESSRRPSGTIITTASSDRWCMTTGFAAAFPTFCASRKNGAIPGRFRPGKG